MEPSVEPGSWPPVSYEKRSWVPSDELLSRRLRGELTGEYLTAVTPAIAALSPEVSAATSALTERATLEMARFDADATELFGDSEIAPVTAVLLRSESAASSEIEHLTVRARQLALAELAPESGAASRNARTVSANVRAMRAAVDLADDLSERSILAMHEILVADQASADPGRWRSVPVWIGGPAPTRAAFVPPPHEHVPEAMADLVAFAQRGDISALVHAAVAHAQLETIHPFADGNGRTGRALVQSMLRRGGVTRRITVPVSAGLLRDTEGYFEALTSYRQGNLEPIVIAFADAAETAVANGRRLIGDLHAIRASWTQAITARRGAGVWRALNVVIAQPVVDARYLQQALDTSLPTAQSAIDTLEGIGALRQSVAGRRRNRVWHAPEVLDALDAFADRAGRREG